MTCPVYSARPVLYKARWRSRKMYTSPFSLLRQIDLVILCHTHMWLLMLNLKLMNPRLRGMFAIALAGKLREPDTPTRMLAVRSCLPSCTTTNIFVPQHPTHSSKMKMFYFRLLVQSTVPPCSLVVVLQSWQDTGTFASSSIKTNATHNSTTRHTDRYTQTGKLAMQRTPTHRLSTRNITF